MAWPAVYALPCTGHSNTINLHIETSIPHRTEQVVSGSALHPRTDIMTRLSVFLVVLSLRITRLIFCHSKSDNS
jgi:hypothetical protein